MEIVGTRGGSLRPILARALNQNQILILSEAAKNRGRAITALLSAMETKYSVPISTLKLNAKVLRELELVSFGDSAPARLTRLGMFVLDVMAEGQSACDRMVEQ